MAKWTQGLRAPLLLTGCWLPTAVGSEWPDVALACSLPPHRRQVGGSALPTEPAAAQPPDIINISLLRRVSWHSQGWVLGSGNENE